MGYSSDMALHIDPHILLRASGALTAREARPTLDRRAARRVRGRCLNNTTSSLVAAYAHAGGGEVACVGVGLETDEVGTKHAVQNFFTTCGVSLASFVSVLGWYLRGRHLNTSELGKGVCMKRPITLHTTAHQYDRLVGE